MYKSVSQSILLLLSLSIFGLMVFRCFRSLTAEGRTFFSDFSKISLLVIDTGTSVMVVKNTEVPPPSFTLCRRDFSAYKQAVLHSYGLWIGKHLELTGYKDVQEKTNKTMADILEEAAFTKEEILDYVSVIDEQMYMEFDKQGESFNLDDFSDDTRYGQVHVVDIY